MNVTTISPHGKNRTTITTTAVVPTTIKAVITNDNKDTKGKHKNGTKIDDAGGTKGGNKGGGKGNGKGRNTGGERSTHLPMNTTHIDGNLAGMHTKDVSFYIIYQVYYSTIL